LTSILADFCQKSGRGDTLPPPPSAWFNCNYRPPKGKRSPAVRWSTVQCGSSQNLSWFPVLGRVECSEWWVLSRANVSLFLSVYSLRCTVLSGFPNLIALWHTTQIPGEMSLLYTSWKQGQNWTDPVTWWSSRTQV
jgi:hypothetical protein